MQWSSLTSQQLAGLDRELPVVLPIAAVEQHGPHLPLDTDSRLLAEIVRRADERLGPGAAFLPLLWLGNSHHHLDFPGTLSADPRGYLDLLTWLVARVLDQGFRRVLLLTGHGGNTTPSEQALFELRQQTRDRDDLLLLSASYWALGPPPQGGFEQDAMGHACEWETSMILRLAPELVGDYASLPRAPVESQFAPAYRAWTTRERTAAGYLGHPAAATAEKGERLLSHFAESVARFVERMAAWDGGW